MTESSTMLRTLRSTVLGLLTVALACPALRADDESPEAVLKRNGLRRSGTTYVLAAEAAVQKKLTEVKGLSKQLAYAVMQQKALEQGTQDSKALLQELRQRRSMLNAQLSQVQTALQNNQLIGAINQLNDQIDMLQESASDPGAVKRMTSQVSQKREAYMQGMLDLRTLIDEAKQKYAELAKNDGVKNAFAALNRTTKAKLTLGPSRAFIANVKLVEKAEGSVQREFVPLREDAGVFEVDVTFNNKVVKSLCLDTGASFISLSAKVAAEIGLKPGKSDPTVLTEIADGSKVQAKLMKIPSVRVGKFTVRDVPCIVAPADQGDVPLLLGGSFLKNFSYHVNPGEGKLILAKVETEDVKDGAKTKAATKSSARGPKGARATKPEPDAGEDSPGKGSEFDGPKPKRGSEFDDPPKE
jgi:aspartyl protease family protein